MNEQQNDALIADYIKKLEVKIKTLEEAINVLETIRGTEGLVEDIEEELMYLQVELHTL